MKIIDYPSPNFSERTAPIDMIILHYTDMKTAEAALERLCDPTTQVSAHYLISKEGIIYRLVPEDKKAYHAGISYWQGRENLNNNSIGIELDNPGHQGGKAEFPHVQIKALIELLRDIRTRHLIPDINIIGHSDVAPDRKQDPGEHFPWQKLAQHGMGLWVTELEASKKKPSFLIKEIQEALAEIGYKLFLSGHIDKNTTEVIFAFQRHFYPEKVDGILDEETANRIRTLLLYAKCFKG